MNLWQAIDLKTEEVIYQADSAKELAVLLELTEHSVYVAAYRERIKYSKKPGVKRKVRIIKVVIDGD